MFTTVIGGILDDCIITRTGHDSFFIVSNAGRADVINDHIKVTMETIPLLRTTLTGTNSAVQW